MRKYRADTRRMNQYQIMIDMAKDKSSKLYNSDGSHNRGASVYAAFWNGFEHGFTVPHLVPEKRNLMYCVFRAGVDYKQAQ
jgi:hypothetical protein